MECKAIAQRTEIHRKHRPTRAARKAQSLIRYHVESGKLQRPEACEECGKAEKIEAAHFNYDEPLRVRWLCCSCHRRWDKRDPKRGTIPPSGWPVSASEEHMKEAAPTEVEAAVETDA